MLHDNDLQNSEIMSGRMYDVLVSITCISEVHRVRLSRRSCIIKVLSLYDSSPKVSNSAMASSKAWRETGKYGYEQNDVNHLSQV